MLWSDSLSEHEVELLVQSGPGICNGSVVAQKTHGRLPYPQVRSRHLLRLLLVDAYFEPSRTPTHEVDRLPQTVYCRVHRPTRQKDKCTSL